MRKQMLWAVAMVFALLGLAAPLALASSDEACPTADPDCCGKKVCCPTTKTWTRPRTEFGMVSEDFCLPPCCWFGGLFGGKCCSGEQNCCGKVRTRRVLIIKVRKEEHRLPDCVPACAPAPCGVAPCPVSCGQAPAADSPQGHPATLHLGDRGMAAPVAIPATAPTRSETTPAPR
jgi:hypothetical protein